MARRNTTRLEASAQRFLVRRMTHALVRRDVTMLDDPMRAQSLSLVAGCVLASIAIAVCGVLAVVRPQGIPESAAFLVARDSGALYVRIGDTLHPVANLASARLILRSAASPVATADAAIASAKRGAAVGIPGAPATIAATDSGQSWTVCDDQRTVVTIGGPASGGADPPRPVLVTPRGEGVASTYLLYEGRRARVDLRSPPVIRGLRLDGVDPIPVSRTLLDLLPEVPAIEAPRIDGAGDAGPPALRGEPIGSVIRVLRAEPARPAADRYYVVLADGVQPIGEVAADVIRFAYERRARTIPTVSPAAIAATPVVATLPVATFPQRAGDPVGASPDRTVCAHWHPGGPGAPATAVTASTSRPAANVVALAQADGEGPNVDAVSLADGRGVYARSARIVGDDGVTGPRFLVTDAGVAYGIRDGDAAGFLGLPESPGAAPWPVLARLPRGPELSVEAASVFRDAMTTTS